MSTVKKMRSDDEDDMTRFTLVMDAGQEEMWIALRELPRSGVTANDLAQFTGVSEGKAANYLAMLAGSKHARKIGVSSTREPVYVLVKHPIYPMVFDYDGEESADFTLRKLVWVAVRTQKTFTLDKIFDFVREHMEARRSQIERYLRLLCAATYLYDITESSKRGGREWTLRPKMNTGPLPPRVCQAKLLYDINKRAFFGAIEAQEQML